MRKAKFGIDINSDLNQTGGVIIEFFSRYYELLGRVLVRTKQVLVAITAIFAVLMGYLYFKPIANLAQSLEKTVSGDYQRALRQIDNLKSGDGEEVNPVCPSKVLTHGQKTDKSIVLFHGFTNCPAQYDQFAKQLYDKGYNVYVPRIPYHGLKDRLTNALASLTAEDLTRTVAQSVDIATGLGSEVTLFGISGGSVMAAWGGYIYPEVKKAFIGAPLFAPADFKFWQLQFSHNLLEAMPSMFRWWDDKTKAEVPGPQYAYPRYSLKAVNAFLHLSLDLQRLLNNQAFVQKDKKLVLVTVQNDPAISNTVARDMIERWAAHPGTTLVQYQFPGNVIAIHDFIDPYQTKQNTREVYPILVDLLEK